MTTGHMDGNLAFSGKFGRSGVPNAGHLWQQEADRASGQALNLEVLFGACAEMGAVARVPCQTEKTDH